MCLLADVLISAVPSQNCTLNNKSKATFLLHRPCKLLGLDIRPNTTDKTDERRRANQLESNMGTLTMSHPTGSGDGSETTAPLNKDIIMAVSLAVRSACLTMRNIQPC